MDFLKNVAKNVYSGVNKATSYVGDILSQGNANIAGLLGSTYLFNKDLRSSSLKNQPITSSPLNLNQAVSSGGLSNVIQPPAKKALPIDTQYFDSEGVVRNGSINGLDYQTTAGGNASSSYTYTPYELGSYRSALPSVTGNVQDTRVSSKAEGVPYINAKGVLVTPKTGFSGLGGDSSGGLVFNTPSTGSTGLSGGGSAFTGLLGGASGLGTPSAITSEIDPKTGKKKTQIDLNPATGQGTQPAPTLPGVQGQTGGVQVPFVPPSEQLNVKAPPSFDVGALDTMKTQAGDAMIDIGTNDFESFTQNFTKAYETALATINAQNPTPENPVQETPEQASFVEQSEDPFGYRQAMDDFRNSQTDLNSLHTQQIENLKQIQAANQTFTNIVSDTKNNPDLPKGLAMRRINEIQSAQKTQIDQLLGQADIINAQIDNQNEIVNRNFNIATQAKSDNEKEQERGLAKFKLFIDSGAIGAFTDADIKKYAGITGLSTTVIKKMKDSAKDPNLDVYTETNDLGVTTGRDKTTGKVLWTTGAGAGKTKQSTSIGNLTPSQQAAAFKLADDYARDSKVYFDMRSAYNRIQTSVKTVGPAGDLSLLYNYMKMLDPGSTVREGEFATAQNAGSAFSVIGGAYNKIVNGQRLTDGQRADFANQASELFKSANAQQQQINTQYTSRADQFGVPPSLVIQDLTSTSAPTPVNSKPLTPGTSGVTSSGIKFNILSN